MEREREMLSSAQDVVHDMTCIHVDSVWARLYTCR